MEGSDRTCEDIQDTTMLAQIEEAKCAIQKLSYVTKLSHVRAVNGMGPGWQASLSCYGCQEYGSCPKKQEPAVRLSRVHTTELACLQELLKRLQDRHVQCAEAVAKKGAADAASVAAVSPDAPNVLQAMMQLRQAKSRAEAANKLALEAEKERDAAEKAVEELKRHLHPKRTHTQDDAGDAHEMLAEVDNWDLRDHRQQATRVQNHRNVQVGSRDNQQKPRTGKDGFKGTRYSDGDSALVVDLWLHRVADDLSGLTFQEWDPSAGSDDTSAPVAMLVNSSELRATDFPLAEVRPLHLDAVARGGRRTRGAAVRKLQGVGNSTFVISVENDNDFRSRCE